MNHTRHIRNIREKFCLLICAFLLSSVGFSQLITVSQDGTGKYKTIQAAFNAIPLNNKKLITIFIKNGIYKEKLHLNSSKNFISLLVKINSIQFLLMMITPVSFNQMVILLIQEYLGALKSKRIISKPKI